MWVLCSAPHLLPMANAISSAPAPLKPHAIALCSYSLGAAVAEDASTAAAGGHGRHLLQGGGQCPNGEVFTISRLEYKDLGNCSTACKFNHENFTGSVGSLESMCQARDWAAEGLGVDHLGGGGGGMGGRGPRDVLERLTTVGGGGSPPWTPPP